MRDKPSVGKQFVVVSFARAGSRVDPSEKWVSTLTDAVKEARKRLKLRRLHRAPRRAGKQSQLPTQERYGRLWGKKSGTSGSSRFLNHIPISARLAVVQSMKCVGSPTIPRSIPPGGSSPPEIRCGFVKARTQRGIEAHRVQGERTDSDQSLVCGGDGVTGARRRLPGYGAPGACDDRMTNGSNQRGSITLCPDDPLGSRSLRSLDPYVRYFLVGLSARAANCVITFR